MGYVMNKDEAEKLVEILNNQLGTDYIASIKSHYKHSHYYVIVLRNTIKKGK